MANSVWIAPGFQWNSAYDVVDTPALGSTQTATGLQLLNSTPATAAATVQRTPRLSWKGNAWDTGASQTVEFWIDVLPVTAATPSGTLGVFYSLNGGTAVNPFFVSSGGNCGNATINNASLQVSGGTSGGVQFNGGAGTRLISAVDGQLKFSNAAVTIGSVLAFDALPTIASGFGTSPSVTAGSTPLAGSINVGTGGIATSGVLNFAGTAFPSAPFVVIADSLDSATRVTAVSTTQMTFTTTVAWTASNIISWIVIGARA